MPGLEPGAARREVDAPVTRTHSHRRDGHPAARETGDATLNAGSFRAGFCALVGLPNVGKSTLLNVLVGQKLSIVTPKAQTTRRRFLGIYTDEAHQAVFVDTPGLLEPRYLLQEAMRDEAERAIHDSDLLVYIVDAGFPRSVEHAIAYVPPARLSALACLNKIDRVSPERLREIRAALTEAGVWRGVFETVATQGLGVDALRAAILEQLPESPPLYPPDQLATASVREVASELIRETCFEELGEEVPYATAVEVEEFKEERDPVYISAYIYVEKESQKGIVIGSGGRMIRRIGQRSREKIEAFLGERVYLELRVKVMPNWRRRRGRLKLLGYTPPTRRS